MTPKYMMPSYLGVLAKINPRKDKDPMPWYFCHSQEASSLPVLPAAWSSSFQPMAMVLASPHSPPGWSYLLALGCGTASSVGSHVYLHSLVHKSQETWLPQTSTETCWVYQSICLEILEFPWGSDELGVWALISPQEGLSQGL